jgi:hypothetical protein
MVVWYHATILPTGGTMNEQAQNRGGKEDHPKHFEIQIDRAHFEVTSEVMTGQQLRQLPTPPIGADRDLFKVVPGGSDLKIENDGRVDIKSGLRFFTAPAQINPGFE